MSVPESHSPQVDAGSATSLSEAYLFVLFFVGTYTYYTARLKNIHSFTFEYISQKSIEFNNFWSAKSWENYACKISKFLPPHVLEKCHYTTS